MKFTPILAVCLGLFSLTLVACNKSHEAHHEHHAHAVIATNPHKMDVTVTERYVCQIHSRRHIEVRALKEGYLEAIPVKEGQAVKQGELMFKILPTLYEATRDAEAAEAQLAQIELANTKRLFEQRVVSDREVALAEAKLTKALAQAKLAQAELNFTDVTAPFDGIIDRLHEQQGSLIEEGDMLTTLSDNDVMWVYFNVPEANYLEYKARLDEERQETTQVAATQVAAIRDPAVHGAAAQEGAARKPEGGDQPADRPGAAAQDDADDKYSGGAGGEEKMHIELELANGQDFGQPGHIAAIEADFNNENGNIAFRADFPNPDLLLRHGQTGTVMIHRRLEDALIIPQRATFEILAKRYVYVLDKDDVVHQREIDVQHVLEDVFVIKGDHLTEDDKIILEGTQQVRDGEKEHYEFRDPEEVLGNLKNKAE